MRVVLVTGEMGEGERMGRDGDTKRGSTLARWTLQEPGVVGLSDGSTNLPRTSLSRPSKHYYCHHHGWMTTHGGPSGHGGHHGDPCQFMKSRLSEPLPC